MNSLIRSMPSVEPRIAWNARVPSARDRPDTALWYMMDGPRYQKYVDTEALFGNDWFGSRLVLTLPRWLWELEQYTISRTYLNTEE